MQNKIIAALVAIAIALSVIAVVAALHSKPAGAAEIGCVQSSHCGQRSGVISVRRCLSDADWAYVRNSRNGCWWATTKNNIASPQFRAQCGTMTMPIGTRDYGYRGKATSEKIVFSFQSR